MSEDLISHILAKKCTDIPVPEEDVEKLPDPFVPDLQSSVTNLQSPVLPPTLLHDIDLHLECDEDGIVSVPGETATISGLPHSVIGQNVSLRITFPLQRQNIEKEKPVWKCTMCKEHFTKQSKLALHLQKVHDVEKGFQCPECSFATKEARLLRRHHIRIHSPKQYDSSQMLDKDACQPQTEIDKPLIHDLPEDNNMDSDDGRISNSCDKDYPDPQLFQPCGVAIDNSDMQFTELKSKEFRYVCSKCPFQTLHKDHLTLHFTNIHDLNGETFKCEKCDYQCKQKRSLVKHEQCHNSSKSENICPVCGKDCKFPYALKRHKLCHEDDKKVRCEIETCGKEFKNINTLKSHMFKVHNKSESKHLQSDDAQNHKTFVCSWSGCGKSFRDSYNLKAHMCLHTGEKPIKCPHCVFRCVQKTSLSCHMKKMHS